MKCPPIQGLTSLTLLGGPCLPLWLVWAPLPPMETSSLFRSSLRPASSRKPSWPAQLLQISPWPPYNSAQCHFLTTTSVTLTSIKNENQVLHSAASIPFGGQAGENEPGVSHLVFLSVPSAELSTQEVLSKWLIEWLGCAFVTHHRAGWPLWKFSNWLLPALINTVELKGWAHSRC